MPGTMFQELVSSRERAHRRWYTLPLSFLAHTVLIAIVIVVPLVATVALPMPRAALLFIDSYVMPVVLAPPPATPRREMAAAATSQASMSAPLVAPDDISRESGVMFEQQPIETQTIDGVVRGLNASMDAMVEAAPPRPTEPDAPVRVGVEITPPARTRYVPPEYPEIARSARVEGVVIIEAIIGIDGRVENAQVLRSSPLLDKAALAAVRAWEYTPTLLNGKPTAIIMTVTVRFTLN